MRKKKVIVIILLTLAHAVAAAYLLYPRPETYTFYGTEIITTTAPSNILGTILHQTAWELGDTIAQEDGGKHLPSFHQEGKNWKDEDSKITTSRGITEFDDKDGNHSVIETVAIGGRPKVILLKSDTDDSTMKLANELIRQFRIHKIKRKE